MAKIRVGDVVTWGKELWAHRVVEVDADGDYLYVDATSAGCGPKMLVHRYDRPRITDAIPDVPVHPNRLDENEDA